MWYAVWVRSGQEDRVLELCKTFRHYYPDAYEECFIPTYEKYRKVKGQPTKQLAHLLPDTSSLSVTILRNSRNF